MHRPRVRAAWTVALVLGAAMLVTACVPPSPPSSPAAEDMVVRHNDARAFLGRAGLAVDGGLQANAQSHADRLAAGTTDCSNLWHSPELGSWYAGFAAAENIACISGCPTNAQAAFDLWMRSPAHAQNALNPAFALIGVATSCNGSVQIVVAHYRS